MGLLLAATCLWLGAGRLGRSAGENEEQAANAQAGSARQTPSHPRGHLRRGCPSGRRRRRPGRHRPAQHDAVRAAASHGGQPRPDQEGCRRTPDCPERPGRNVVGRQARQVPVGPIHRRRPGEQDRADLLSRAEDRGRRNDGANDRFGQGRRGKRFRGGVGTTGRAAGGEHPASCSGPWPNAEDTALAELRKLARAVGGQGAAGGGRGNPRRSAVARSGRPDGHHAAAPQPGTIGDRAPARGCEGSGADWKESLLQTGRYGDKKVDFLLEGEGTSAFAAQIQGLTSCRARVELRLIAVPGRTIAVSDRGVAAGVDLVEALAAKTALEEAGVQACDAVIRQFAKYLERKK